MTAFNKLERTTILKVCIILKENWRLDSNSELCYLSNKIQSRSVIRKLEY